MAKTLGKWAPAAILGAALLGLVSLAHGQGLACARETAGQLSVQAGVRCQCVRIAEGSITGASAGYAWDCGVLRGRMNQLVPPAPDAYQGPLPEAIILDADEPPVRPRTPRWVPRP